MSDMNILEISQIIFNITVSAAIVFTFAFLAVILFMIFQSVRTLNQFFRQCKQHYQTASFIFQEFVGGIKAFTNRKPKKK